MPPGRGGTPVAVTDAQVRMLMGELTKYGNLGLAAVKAGMDRKTARKYREARAFPAKLQKPRGWRTREAPFEEDWPPSPRTRPEKPPPSSGGPRAGASGRGSARSPKSRPHDEAGPASRVGGAAIRGGVR